MTNPSLIVKIDAIIFKSKWEFFFFFFFFFDYMNIITINLKILRLHGLFVSRCLNQLFYFAKHFNNVSFN